MTVRQVALALGIVKDGDVFGRGAIDFKGGIAVFARAVMALAERKVPLARDVNHQPEFTAHCATPDADKSVYDGALAMAWTAVDLARDAMLAARLMGQGAGR